MKHPQILSLATVLSAVFLAPGLHALNTTYYVDSVAGNDVNAGTLSTAPWKNLSRVNAVTFGAGDKILFKKGSSWNGQLHPLGSGTSASPITIDAYGTGSAPIIAGSSLASGATVLLNNQSYWTIQNLEITNASDTSNTGTVNPNGTYTPGVERYGILVLTTNTQAGITIQGNFVHNVNGAFISTAIDPHIVAGIAIHDEGALGKCNNVKILGNVLDHCGREGISAWHERYFNTNNIILDPSQMATGLVIQDNAISNSDADAIIVFGYNGPLIDGNINQNAGLVSKPGYNNNTIAGIWPTRSVNSVMQYNESSGCRTNPDQAGLPTDGEGFDVDIGCQGALVQYNYSHDNQGGFILLEGPVSSNVTVRYNLSVNDGNMQGLFTLAVGTPYNLNIYNNTIYIGAASGAVKPIYSVGGASTKNYNFVNNIFYNLGSGVYELPDVAGVKYGTFDHNVFYGNHPVSEPQDPVKSTANPLLSSPGTAPSGRTAPTGYKLMSTSPAIISGALLDNNGGVDYWGGAIIAASNPNRGSDNTFALNTGIKDIFDTCNSFNLTFSHTSNVVLDTDVVTTQPSNADNFDGDTARFKRNSTATGSIVYKSTKAKSFKARIYKFTTSDLTKVKFYSSPNGTTWTLVPTTNTTPFQTTVGGSWYSTVFSPTIVLPVTTNYLKVEFSDTLTATSPELGQISISTF